MVGHICSVGIKRHITSFHVTAHPPCALALPELSGEAIASWLFPTLSHLKFQCIMCPEKNKSSLACTGYQVGNFRGILNSMLPSHIQSAAKSCQFSHLSRSPGHHLILAHLSECRLSFSCRVWVSLLTGLYTPTTLHLGDLQTWRSNHGLMISIPL